MPNVLLGCSANMCRSPMAELLLKHELEQRGIAGWKVHSAGTNASVGWPAARGAVEAMRKLNLDLSKHRSRCVTPAMMADADLVLYMAQANRAEMERLLEAVPERVIPLSNLAGRDDDIEDPMGGPPEAFVDCANELRSIIGAGLDWLEQRLER